MKTIEQLTELHHDINNLNFTNEALRNVHSLSDIFSYGGWAANGYRHKMEMRTYISPTRILVDDERFNSFSQGFHCVAIHLYAMWGGCHHNGTPRTETEFGLHVLDRLHGGMNRRSWSSTGSWRSELICFEDIIPLLEMLLTPKE